MAFVRRALTKIERNYSVYDLEMYEVICAVINFNINLRGRESLLQTDN